MQYILSQMADKEDSGQREPVYYNATAAEAAAREAKSR